METLLNRFGLADLLAMLTSIGVMVRKTPDGWYYPLSNSAQSVVETISSALNQAGVILSVQTQVKSIRVSKGGFTVQFIRDDKQQEKEYERLILSAGGTAYPSLGSRGDLFPILERLAHTVLPKRPALAPLLVDLGFVRLLQGVRLNVGATLWKGSQRLAVTTGNLIVTQWGLNGPAVMDLSHQVSKYSGEALELSLNLLAFFREEFNQLLGQKRTSLMPVRVFLDAFFPPKVTDIYLKNAGLAEETPLGKIDDRTLERLVELLKNNRLPVKGMRGFEYCQISAGGVPVTEVNPYTMKSLRVKGLYLTGETFDVVGPCGGYNLQIAFSSGALAGRAAAG
jgi:hypothetical protein